jgi:hypothetical protein
MGFPLGLAVARELREVEHLGRAGGAGLEEPQEGRLVPVAATKSLSRVRDNAFSYRRLRMI